jgi:hypothetical protein
MRLLYLLVKSILPLEAIPVACAYQIVIRHHDYYSPTLVKQLTRDSRDREVVEESNSGLGSYYCEASRLLDSRSLPRISSTV